MATTSKEMRRAALVAAALLAFPLGLTARAAEDEPADAPLPEITAQVLAERIQAAWQGVRAGQIEVAFDEERPPDAFDLDASQLPDRGVLQFPGRFQRASDGRRWRVEFDAMAPTSKPRRLTPDRWTSGFDGSRHYVYKTRGNEVIFGESENRAAALQPRELFWPQSERLLEILGTAGTRIGQKTAEGMRCYVVELAAGRWRTKYLIAPRQGYLALSMTQSADGLTILAHRLTGLVASDRGDWRPREITSEWFGVAQVGGSTYLGYRPDCC